ncbi:amidohydrolase [Actinomadura graeca]|uniref:6-methylsalicylate decarboxylase n=1 Tax=Actinomadura graeca TaxID=2750812 RepID=A0ABX8QRE1_9ACTN|nr:amidohydrolase family protein [Actinomadura graeca]QXJ21350.1 amidohydrolase [Actinomadura graeca]
MAAPPTTPPPVDVHHHAILPRYRAELESLGIGAQPGVGFPPWTPEASLDWLDSAGIGKALLSVASPGFFFGDHAQTVRLTAMCNEDLMRLRDRHSGRFGVFATVPLPCLAESLDEVERALGRRAFDGVALLTHYGGGRLGEPRWSELLSLLDDHGALVHVHPTVPHEWPADAPLRPSLLDYPFETTRTFLTLASHRAFSRYPRIRWIFSHGGGTVPFLEDRLTAGIDGSPLGGGDTMRQAMTVSCFDTALLGDPALAALTTFAGRDRILFGSDLPFVNTTRATALATRYSRMAETYPSERHRVR